MRTCSKGIQV